MADKKYKLIFELSDGNEKSVEFTVPQGEKGDAGKTAYEYAKDGGYTGTEEEFKALMANTLTGGYDAETKTLNICSGVTLSEDLEEISDYVIEKIVVDGVELSFATDDTLTVDGKAADAKVVGEKFNKVQKEKVNNPDTGVVGQILEIETVDENGKPKTYKAVDKPTSGSSDPSDVDKILYEKALLGYDGEAYKPYPIELENYSWNHLAGTKRIAPLAEKATLFTTEGATAHEANAVGFNGSWLLFQWVQNTAGTTVDMEDASGSCEIQGKLNYWRYGIGYDKTGESKTFTIAKQGDAIKRTVTGDAIEASGGVGICNVANKDSLTIYSIATYYHNGSHIPTTREIAIDSTDYTTTYDGKLTIGEATMWTITKDGLTSDWNDSVLGTEYGGHVNCQIYCDYNASGYNYYMAVVKPNKGVSIITSTDCTNWTWLADVDIPIKNTAYIETAFTLYGSRWYVAVRCKDGRLWVAKIMSDYSINWNFFMPDCGSKPQFLSFAKNLILACAPQSRYSCRLYRFTTDTKDLSYDVYPDRIEAIGDITYNACNYPFFCCGNGKPATGGPDNHNASWGFLCLGTNNFVTNKLGCSYFVDTPFAYLRYPNEAVNALNEKCVLPLATSENLGGVMPVTKTEAMTQSVGVDEVGALWTAPSSSSEEASGGDYGYVVDTLIDTILEEETTYVDATIDSLKYRKFYAYIKNVGTTTNTGTGGIVLVANPTAANSQGFASSPAISNCITADAVAYADMVADLYNGCSYSNSHLALNNAGTQSGYSSRMYTLAGCDTVFETLRVQFNNQWQTFGVGTEIKVFGVRA